MKKIIILMYLLSFPHAYANELVGEIDEVTDHNSPLASESFSSYDFLSIENSDLMYAADVSYATYTPPKWGVYNFLAFSAEENPYPNAVSYDAIGLMQSRAYGVCKALGDRQAVAAELENRFATDFPLAYSTPNGFTFIEKYSKKLLNRPGVVGKIEVPISYFKKLMCTKF
jgi:hypothetical protein